MGEFEKAVARIQGQTDFQQKSRESFEVRCIQYLINQFDLPVRRLYDAHEQIDGTRRLRWAVFNEEYYDFPYYLGSYHESETWQDKNIQLPVFFKRFGQSIFACAYDDFWDQHRAAAGSRPAGLIVPMKGAPNGLLIYESTVPACTGPAWALRVAHDNDEYTLWFQPFRSIVQKIIEQGWTPAS